MEIPARLDMVAVVRMITDAVAAARGSLAGDRVDDLRWVVSEAVTNGINATIRGGKGGSISIRCLVLDRGVQIEVSDRGPGMPAHLETLDIEDPDRLSVEGGFGIPLMKHICTGPVSFASSPAGTTVSLQVIQ